MANRRQDSDFKKPVDNGNDDLIINRYRIEKKLNKNEKAIHYLVSDVKNNSLKTIKKIAMSTGERNLVKEMIRDEFILSSLDCPFIVRYHESFLHNDDLFIVTEYCESGDLATYLKEQKQLNQKIPEEKIIFWLSQLLNAVHYLHRKTIMHRNIKPGNILMKQHILKLTDMGVSRTLDNSGKANTFIGTPYYMSPEVVQNKPYSLKSDIWSLGCVLYEMATFQRPFVGDKIMSIFESIVEDPAPGLVNIYSKELNSILKNMLNKNADLRPSAIELLSERLIFKNTKYLIESSIGYADTANKIVPLINSLASLNNLIECSVFGNLEYDNMGTLKTSGRNKNQNDQ